MQDTENLAPRLAVECCHLANLIPVSLPINSESFIAN